MSPGSFHCQGYENHLAPLGMAGPMKGGEISLDRSQDLRASTHGVSIQDRGPKEVPDRFSSLKLYLVLSAG